VHILSLIAAMLLALFGYSVANALREGKAAAARKPVAFDLAVVMALWVVLIIVRGPMGLNPWIFVLAAIGAGFLVGLLVSLLRGSSAAQSACVVEPHLEKHIFAKRFPRLRAFLFKAGTFQSQIFMGLIFLVVIGPVALAVKAFSDPLRIKKSGPDTHWVPRPAPPAGLESSRKPY
jgi:hypothetical protein